MAKITSYELRSQITEQYDNLQAIEVTTGTNGYPRGLHGAVIGFDSYDEAEKVAKVYGGEVVEFHRRDGWQLWESRGYAFGAYDIDDIMNLHEDIDEDYVSDMEYSYDIHNYAIGVELHAQEDMKTTQLTSDDIKVYQSNIEISRPVELDTPSSISYEAFRDELDRPIHESDARDILAEQYDITEDAADMIVSALYTKEWIIADDEVYLYKVNTYQAYRADEQGIRWMTNSPSDTVDYKHEVLESTTKHLPKGYTYDEDADQFWHGRSHAQLVNENDGTVSLVSADGITTWF